MHARAVRPRPTIRSASAARRRAAMRNRRGDFRAKRFTGNTLPARCHEPWVRALSAVPGTLFSGTFF